MCHHHNCVHNIQILLIFHTIISISTKAYTVLLSNLVLLRLYVTQIAIKSNSTTFITYSLTKFMIKLRLNSRILIYCFINIIQQFKTLIHLNIIKWNKINYSIEIESFLVDLWKKISTLAGTDDVCSHWGTVLAELALGHCELFLALSLYENSTVLSFNPSIHSSIHLFSYSFILIFLFL